MKYGVAYYPEQSSNAQMETDMKLIAESGINVVRMGEFAWCKFEPAEGDYQFDWLDTVIAKLGGMGVETIVCTPTACPPAWLVEKYPEILYVDNRGVKRPFGGRRHSCYNNPIYRQYCGEIAEQLAIHYGSNPYVCGFQIDNELAQEGTGRCHCSCCRELFQKWLEDRYQNIEEVNRRWGTVFWGQTYNHFSQIGLPVNSIETGAEQSIAFFYENPSLRLNFERFCSESNVSFLNNQLEVMRRHTDKIITTNGTGLATNSIDYYDCFKKPDCYAFDYYPSLRDGEVPSFDYAFGRGVKSGKNFAVLEFVSGGGHKLGGSGRLQPYPGAMKQAVVHAFANGADLLAHFQFRTFLCGAEQLNYAILDADGIPRRRYAEMKQTADELKKLAPFLEKSRVHNEAAVCFDYDTLWALKIKPVNRDSFDYLKSCGKIYRLLMCSGFGTDVIPYSANFDDYKFLVLPAPILLSEKMKQKLKTYVENGGTVLSTFLCGAKNTDNAGIAESLPCGLTDLFGITVSEAEPVFPETVSKVRIYGNGNACDGENREWLEVLETRGAEPIGYLTDTFRKGNCILGRNRFEKGTAYYLGTGLDDGLMEKLLNMAAAKAGVGRVPFRFPKGVEVITREYERNPAYFIFNFLGREITVRLDKTYTGYSQKEYLGKITLGAKDYEFLY